MNGAEHYQQAELLLREAEEGPSMDTRLALGVAQVHATLALAAATAMASVGIAADGETGRVWRQAIVARPAPSEPDHSAACDCAEHYPCSHQWHRDPVTNEPTTCIHCGISQQRAEDEEQQAEDRAAVVGGIVWCDKHASPHEDSNDPFDSPNDTCTNRDHRVLWVRLRETEQAEDFR